MLLLVTGASGVGKSAVRHRIAPRLTPAVESVELRDLDATGAITLPWRQETAELAAGRAARLRGVGRHLLLCGDPVAAAEVVAAPSAVDCGGVAVCLLDAAPEALRQRLAARGDDPAFLEAHLGFAAWMREQAHDPMARLDVVATDGAAVMRWERLREAAVDDRWRTAVIDTTALGLEEAAAGVEAWIRDALVDDRLVMHPEVWSTA